MVLEELLTHWPLKQIRAILPRMLISHTGGNKMDSVQARNFSFGAQGPLPSKKLGTFEKIWGQYNQRSNFYRKCTCCFQMLVFCSM